MLVRAGDNGSLHDYTFRQRREQALPEWLTAHSFARPIARSMTSGRTWGLAWVAGYTRCFGASLNGQKSSGTYHESLEARGGVIVSHIA